MKRGVALLWSLILIIILLITSGVMATYIVKESQSTVRIEESTQAYSAAKSGIEWAQDFLLKNPDTTTNKNLSVYHDNDVTVTITREADNNLLIKSVGIFNGVQRAIEQKNSDIIYTDIMNPNPPDSKVISATNNDSFTLLFDFWVESPSTTWLFGASTATRDSYIALVNTGSQLAIRVKKPGLSPEPDVAIPGTNTTDYLGQGNMVRAEIKYIKGIGLSVRIKDHFAEEGACIAATSIDLRTEMSNLNYLYTNGMSYDAALKAVVQPTNAAFFQNLFIKTN